MRPLILALLLSILPALPAAAQGWALDGFDPVGYGANGRATPGRSDISTMWKGQLWHFASEANRARFEANPQSYAPALDGICPMSIIEGRAQPGDPRFFSIVGGRLYLLGSGARQRDFNQNPARNAEQARRMWRDR